MESTEVKNLVAADLRKRKLTHQKVAELTGFGRQTIANLLSNKDYFSERQAMIFGLQFGYNPTFLMTGEGPLFKAEPANDINEYNARLNSILLNVFELSTAMASIVNKYDKDVYDPLLNKVQSIYSIISTLLHAPRPNIETQEHDVNWILSAESVLQPYFADVWKYINENFEKILKPNGF